MAVTNKRLIEGAALTASASALYAAPAKARTIIKRLTLANCGALPASVTVYLVPPSGSAGDASTAVKARTLAAGETWICGAAEGHVLESGGSIQAVADAAGVTLMASGVEVA